MEELFNCVALSQTLPYMVGLHCPRGCRPPVLEGSEDDPEDNFQTLSYEAKRCGQLTNTENTDNAIWTKIYWKTDEIVSN